MGVATIERWERAHPLVSSVVTGLEFFTRSSQRKFGKLIIRKIIKSVVTSCHILQPKCTKFRLGFCPRPPGELAALQRP